MASTPPVDPNGSTATQGIDFPAVQRSHEFQRLRSTHRSFVFPLAIAFLVWTKLDPIRMVVRENEDGAEQPHDITPLD